MAGVDGAADSFALPLRLWQRATFLSPPSSSARGQGEGRGARDAVRLRIAQLDYEYWKQ